MRCIDAAGTVSYCLVGLHRCLMKTDRHSFHSLLISGLLLLSTSAALRAIPQTFGGGQFLSAVDKPAEQFFANIAMWKPGAKLPGEWIPVETPPSAVRAREPGPVFGVQADSLTLVREDDGTITEIRVGYSPKGSGLAETALLARLRTNLKSFTAAKPAVSGGLEKYAGSGLVIALKKTAGGPVLHLTSAAGGPPVKVEKK